MSKFLIPFLICFTFQSACKEKGYDKSSGVTDSIPDKPLAVEPAEIKRKILWDSIKNSEEDYSNFIALIKTKRLSQKKIVIKEGGKDEIIYLGAIKDSVGMIVSHVLTLYGEVQAAIVIHGHSMIVFIDAGLQQKKEYYLNGPEQLPFKLEDNSLYFHYEDENSAKENLFVNQIGNELPTIMCYAPNTCL